MSPRSRSPLTIEFTLLGLLQNRPKHGYELYKDILQSPGLSMIWNVKIGKLYSLLDRLDQDGLLSSSYVSDEKSPGRKEYELLEKGRLVFQDWARSPVKNGRDMRLLFHARLYFAMEQGVNNAINYIEAQQKECDSWVKRLHSQLNKMEHPDLIVKRIYLYRIGQVKAMITWLEDYKKDLSTQIRI